LIPGSQASAWEPAFAKLCFARREAELPRRTFPNRAWERVMNQTIIVSHVVSPGPLERKRFACTSTWGACSRLDSCRTRTRTRTRESSPRGAGETSHSHALLDTEQITSGYPLPATHRSAGLRCVEHGGRRSTPRLGRRIRPVLLEILPMGRTHSVPRVLSAIRESATPSLQPALPHRPTAQRRRSYPT
jgi:hypothetical protein